MNTGMDPEVKKYFRKIIASFSWGLLWLVTIATAGFYFKLALFDQNIHWYNWIFYAFFLLTLALLLRYYYNTWKNG